MRELWAGVIMACRRWQAMLGISLMITAACVVFALALEDVVSQVAVYFTLSIPFSYTRSQGSNILKLILIRAVK